MIKHALLSLILLLFLTCGSSARAGVFRCLGKEGIYEFQDRICDSTEQETFLPYMYNATDPNSQDHGVRRELSGLKKEKTYQKKQREKIRAQKQLEKEALKDKRREIRCKRTQEKIQIAEQRLRLGCRALHCIRLKEQIAHDQTMRQRYCITQKIQ
jgi:hypothetical protein